MAALAPPVLRLQPKHTNRPYGGGWWPDGHELNHQLLDLVSRWPAALPSIASYAFLRDDWAREASSVPARHRTRTLILGLTDRSSCRLLVIPHSTNPSVAGEILGEVSDPHSSWTQLDFASTARSPVPR